MKNLLLILLVNILLSSCGILPLDVKIKENHFRFENFKVDKGKQLEYVYLMCFHQKPTVWKEPKQYLSGKHELWVKANISKQGAPNSLKEAFVKFKVKLDPGKSYMLNRKIVKNNISIWIQEVETGIKVSEVITATLKRPLIIDNNLRKKQCELSSI